MTHYTRITHRTSWLIAVVLAGCGGERQNEDRSSQIADALQRSNQAQELELIRNRRLANPRAFSFDYSQVTLWWERIPQNHAKFTVVSGESSNITKDQYAGPQSCQKCHEKNYQAWSEHPHRWMNALAIEENVRGDFSGDTDIKYLGGVGEFYRDKDENFRMRLQRDDITRDYVITQTIGSRFFQYYIGKQVDGPEPANHYFYNEDHVLPFGYWLDYQRWVPIVHVSDRITCDSYTNDPYVAADVKRYVKCNSCHTTFALGDRIVRDLDIIGRGSPFDLQFEMGEFMQAAHPELVPADNHLADMDDESIDQVFANLSAMEAPEHAVTLGISCEACHLGLKEHVDDPEVKPEFHPRDPHLVVRANQRKQFFTKGNQNLNWTCSRCHVGPRPQYAGEMSTWNSTEASDAMRGSCYSQLTCIDCHDPHQAIGKQWTKTPAQDDQSCLNCHSEFEAQEARQAHTHHAPNSAGSHCMDCHMPRLNEGLQDVVRTHTIFSPTSAKMIEANQPNACNMCHTDKSIDWTTDHLADWYGAEFDERKLATAYENRTQSAAIGWLHSEEEAVRLIGADSLIRQRDHQAIPELLSALDDPFLINRQFAYAGLKRMLGADPEEYGYRFYQTPKERSQPLEAFRNAILEKLKD